MIITLIAGLAKNKYRLEWTIIISSVILGLMHFTNLGMQKFAATLSQATYVELQDYCLLSYICILSKSGYQCCSTLLMIS